MRYNQTYFPRATAQQRKLLFETWEATGSVTKASQRAHLSRQTFYRWKARFDAQGYAGLVEPEKTVRKQQKRVPAAIAEEVIQMRRAHAQWGKKRIADELAKVHHWVRVVSHSTVRRILQEAGLWQEPTLQKKNERTSRARQAEQPGQTVNVDLCFVPWEHGAPERLPAVSGSSGRLVVERSAREPSLSGWPGQVFDQADLAYALAMQQYAHTTRDRLKRGRRAPRLPERQPTAWRKEWEGRAARHRVLQRRRQEDADWRAERMAHHQVVEDYRALSRQQRAQQAADWQAHKAHWAQREQARQSRLTQRKAENQRWHQRIQQRKQTHPQGWIAVLVITDNATRQCLGLPVFASGAKVTAREVVRALRRLLPTPLDFLISDQGTHFRTKLFAQLAQDAQFVHIPIYRHRPQTNGIAERFVRTLKQDLRDLHWSGPQALRGLLEDFLPGYNDRPHQGIPIPGLSPNEFAARIWLF